MILSPSAQLIIEVAWLRVTGRARRSRSGTDRESEGEEGRGIAPIAGPQIDDLASGGSRVVDFLPAAGPVQRGSQLTAGERRARAAALRGLAFARQRRYDAARSAFAEAAKLDPVLDLTRTPGFWNLGRGAHEAVVAAYLDAGRERDATVLHARIQRTFRPRPLPAAAHV